MNRLFETLEERVAAAAALIAHLRSEVGRLESELASTTRPRGEAADPAEDVRALREEIVRLQAERDVVRDRVRGLIREIDAVTW